jgi:membrane protease YdiL (CAAX protease family)
LIALLILVPFGSLLADLRERTDSVVPGMVVHALFNAAAITVSVLNL